jgi:hypothetical protein
MIKIKQKYKEFGLLDVKQHFIALELYANFRSKWLSKAMNVLLYIFISLLIVSLILLSIFEENVFFQIFQVQTLFYMFWQFVNYFYFKTARVIIVKDILNGKV